MFLLRKTLDPTQIEVGTETFLKDCREQAEEMLCFRVPFSADVHVPHLQRPGLYGSLETTVALDVTREALLVRLPAVS